MTRHNQTAAIAIAAMLSTGSISHALGVATSHGLVPEIQSSQSYAAGPSYWKPQLVAYSAKDDWTAWGGSMRGTSALRGGH
jgi:hypothetical protein